MGDPRRTISWSATSPPEHAALRWTFLHPELRFRLKETSGQSFEMRFVIPRRNFKVTGPVTVSCAIEGRRWDPCAATMPANTVSLNLCRPSWLATDKEIHVTFSAEPRWVSPEDGNQLGFLLRSAGFIDHEPGDFTSSSARALRWPSAWPPDGSLLRRLGIGFRGGEAAVFAFPAGAACVSTAVFFLCLLTTGPPRSLPVGRPGRDRLGGLGR